MSVHYERAKLVLESGFAIEMGAGASEIVFHDNSQTEVARIDSLSNLGLGTAMFGTAADSVIGIAIGVEPTTEVAGQIAIYAKDSSAGATDATLGLSLETDPIVVGTFTASHKIPIWINQVEYHIQLDAV